MFPQQAFTAISGFREIAPVHLRQKGSPGAVNTVTASAMLDIFRGSSSPTPKSIKRVRTDKPGKDFAIFSHASGQWVKKVLARPFTSASGPTLLPPDGDTSTITWILKQAENLGPVNCQKWVLSLLRYAIHFLKPKQALMEAGELSPRSRRDYL